MTREKMLEKLHRLRYCVLWPGNWEDIGFTERPIWINSDGYGYYSDDEPCRFLELQNLTDDFVKQVSERLSSGKFTLEDIKGSPLDAPSLEPYIDDEEWLASFLNEYTKSNLHNEKRVFCGEDFEGWSFFKTEEDLIQAFAKDYDYGAFWDEMDEDKLSKWYTRLFEEEQYYELPLQLGIVEE